MSDQMVDPYIEIKITDKILYLLKLAVESHIALYKYHAEVASNELGDDWDGSIGVWDGNDILLLCSVVEEFKRIQSNRKDIVAQYVKDSHKSNDQTGG